MELEIQTSGPQKNTKPGFLVGMIRQQIFIDFSLFQLFSLFNLWELSEPTQTRFPYYEFPQRELWRLLATAQVLPLHIFLNFRNVLFTFTDFIHGMTPRGSWRLNTARTSQNINKLCFQFSPWLPFLALVSGSPPLQVYIRDVLSVKRVRNSRLQGCRVP